MKPIVANIKPKKAALIKGEEYHFCACGRSSNQPFCDGSHAGTDFKPMPFVAEEDGDAYLCQCKHSGNLPFCDGSHKQFDEKAIGKEGPGVQAKGANIPVASATRKAVCTKSLYVIIFALHSVVCCLKRVYTLYVI